jgi:Tfp pilus assembly protein PilO
MAKPALTTKHLQIQKAASSIFLTVAAAAVVVSMSLVILNILWGNAKYNSKVQGLQEETRDTLKANLAIVPDLRNSFENLEIGADLIPEQGVDKKNSEVVLDALPSKFDYPGLASSIDNLARRSSVKLEAFKGTDLGSGATQSSPNPAPEAIPFSVEVEGPYSSIKKFLQGIEDSIRPLKVTRVSLTGTDDKLRASFDMETYYQPAFDLTVRKEAVR